MDNRAVDNRDGRSATLRLTIAISLGVLLIAVGTWFSFSETLRSLEQRSRLTYLAIGLFGALVPIIWLRRMRLWPLKTEPVLFFYGLCEALGLTILAVLLVSWGFGGFISPMGEWICIFLAGAFIVTAYVLMLYRTLRRSRGTRGMKET